MSKIPVFTYVLRRMSEVEKCQAQVVVIRSVEELSWTQVLLELEALTHYPANEFEEVCQEPDTSIILDTWEPVIENLKPSDMEFPAVKIYRGWWRGGMLEPTHSF
jgi:hypothetical protein